MASVSLPIRPPANDKPFRFLDLPGEIRNKIYALVLTAPKPILLPKKEPNDDQANLGENNNREADNNQESDDQIDEDPADDNNILGPPLKLNIETQILRTCRLIKSESEYVLRSTNLFIKLTFKTPIEVKLRTKVPEVPPLPLEAKHFQVFRAFVLSHEITVPEPLQERSRVFIMLHRDLEAFCSALTQSQPELTQHQDLIMHNVTLRDPCAGNPAPTQEPFLSRSLQEKLVSPYRAKIRNFPHLEFKGTIPQDLKVAAEKEPRRPLPLDPEGIIREVEDLKAEGNLYFRRVTYTFGMEVEEPANT